MDRPRAFLFVVLKVAYSGTIDLIPVLVWWSDASARRTRARSRRWRGGSRGRVVPSARTDPSVATEEFPEIDRELLGSSAVSIPNSGGSHSPTGRNRRTRAITPRRGAPQRRDVLDRRVRESGVPAKERDPDADRTVSTYGDSYCFCREVDNDETFQNYLAQELDTHVANYGGETTGSIRRSCGSNASIPTTRPTTSSWSSPPHRSPASSASGNTIRSSATFSRSNPDTSSRTATSSASRVPSTRRTARPRVEGRLPPGVRLSL